MAKQVYEDYKYFLQDVSYFYVGSKYTLKEITKCDEITYKFRKVIAESIIPAFDPEDTLETVLYYLGEDDFVFQIFKQMGASVRVSIKRYKKHLFGPETEEYSTEYMKIADLVKMSKEDKEYAGVMVQELKGSKLALLTV